MNKNLEPGWFLVKLSDNVSTKNVLQYFSKDFIGIFSNILCCSYHSAHQTHPILIK